MSGLVKKSASSQQPVSIATEVDLFFFQLYKKGVLAASRGPVLFFQWCKTGVLWVSSPCPSSSKADQSFFFFSITKDRCEYSSVRISSFLQLHRTDVITAMCETERHHGILAVRHCTECGTDEWNAIFLFSVSRQMWPLVQCSIASCRVLPPASPAHTPSHYRTW